MKGHDIENPVWCPSCNMPAGATYDGMAECQFCAYFWELDE